MDNQLRQKQGSKSKNFVIQTNLASVVTEWTDHFKPVTRQNANRNRVGGVQNETIIKTKSMQMIED